MTARLSLSRVVLSSGFLVLISAGISVLEGRSAVAGELRELYRGARAQAMGNAFSALADDEQALFYNPAGLAGNERFTFHYAAIDAVASTDLVGELQNGSRALKNFNSDSVNQFLGKNLSTQAQFASIFQARNFAAGFLVDEQVSLRSQNKVFPQIDVGYQTTNGFQAGFGIPLTKASRRAKNEFRLGVGVKYLFRRGGVRSLSVVETMNIDKDLIKSKTGNFGSGIGADLGFQHITRFSPRFKLSSAIVYTDIGDVTFSSNTGATAIPDKVKGNLTFGLAAQYELKSMRVAFTYDLRHVTDNTDWRKKMHLGLEVALPVISLYGGLNQVNFTYGASCDIWLVRVTAYSTAEELGSFVHQITERRYALKLAMKFDL